MVPSTARMLRPRLHPVVVMALTLGALLVAAVLVWQGITAEGNPDPTIPHTTRPMAVLDIAVLVFREGLECVLVLAAITAGLRGTTQSFRRPIAAGVGVGLVGTVVTWFIAVGIISDLTANISALSVQAWTGLLAILVLLVVMNWFFHKVYWTGWISFQNRKKRELLRTAEAPNASQARLFLGLGLLGFASLYREGFEVVIFLQSYRLQMGGDIVLYGALLGLLFSGIVAVLAFLGHQRLPYKRMLILTGLLLAGVLFVMIGEEALEMQQAGWISTTTISWLPWLPDWAGTWLSIFPTYETIIAQAIGMVLVIGVYALARYQALVLPRKRGLPTYQLRKAAPGEGQLSDLPESALQH